MATNGGKDTFQGKISESLIGQPLSKDDISRLGLSSPTRAGSCVKTVFTEAEKAQIQADAIRASGVSTRGH